MARSIKRGLGTAAVVLLGLVAAPGFGCEFAYTLIEPSGDERTIETDNATTVRAGEEYTLRMAYREDHRNCSAEPEETVFLLDGARWRPERDTQPLVLAGTPEWEQPSVRSHVGELRFTAGEPGTWTLELIRTCHREGYTGRLEFTVE